VGRVDGLAPRRAVLFLPIADRRAAVARARALRYSVLDIDHLTAVLRTVDALRAFDRVDAPAVRRLVRDAGGALDDALAVAAALSAPRLAELHDVLDRLGRDEDLRSIEPELDGDEVQRVLGIGEGRMVGRALAFLLELRLDHGVLGADEARRRLRQWWDEQGDARRG
jgi:poly(A) polymerase